MPPLINITAIHTTEAPMRPDESGVIGSRLDVETDSGIMTVDFFGQNYHERARQVAALLCGLEIKIQCQ